MTTHAGEFLDKLIPVWRTKLPANVSPRYFDGFVRRNRSALEAMLGEWLDRRAQKKAAASTHELPPDLWSRARRTRANLEAMRIVASRSPAEMTADERRAVLTYSGWGGLSIKDNQDKFPRDLVPETFGLIHEYYTPTVVAEAIAEVVCPLLAQLAGNDGTVRALEPSAGIGRLVRAMGPPRCIFPTAEVKRVQWTTVEFSQVSSRMLEATFPAATHFHMPFERWIRLHGARHTGTINLILSNPPYGDRGEFALEDTDAFYREKTAYAYFMRRALDLLVPGGLGVFLAPAGFLSGVSNRAIREKLLRRHHLAGAYRLPSHTKDRREFVPGANVVMDILFWRSRGGELAEVDADDQFILAGNYFAEFPQHLLGVEQGSFSGDDEAGTATTWRYQVIGDFAGLPQLTGRPLCTACILGPIIRREAPQYQALARAEEGLPDDIGEDVRGALLLGRRVGRYLAALGADEAERAAQLWPELHAALESFTASFGNPWRHKLLRELADKRELVAAQQILGAFTKTGETVAALKAPPEIERKYTGRPDDVIAEAEQLFRQQRALSIGQLEAFHKQVGGELGRAEIVETLLSAEWNLDGDAWDQLLPKDAYLTGNQLWDRYDRAAARAARGDEQAKIQTRRLLDAIKPAVFEDIQDINPQNVYDDVELLAGWLSATLNSNYGPVRLERQGGFVQAVGVDYVDSKNTVGLSPETLAFLGYYNHDPALFQPPREKRDRNDPPPSKEERQENKKRLAERRMELANQWAKSFRDWLAADDARKDRFVHAYNRAARGRIVPTFTPEPLEIARWGAQAPKLKAHQITGARRVLAARGGLVAFDVGVGKTYTALAIIARARQEGWVRRPVILVPGSLVWKWHDDILCTLPDYRVAVIGSKRKRISRGRRKDVLTSETDTPQERAAKWIALQSGQVDVVVLSFDALARTRMNENAVLDYIAKVESVERAIALRKRNLEEKAESRKGREKMSERERALLEHGVRAWVREILTLPEGYEYDPGVAWDELGIDMLVVDEAAAFKNLHMPQAREDGVPKFMGGGGEGSDRAWQVDFRAAAVRKNTGGAGIVLLTATPAKNSPLEFYNLIQFIDPAAFTSAGIHDPEQFIDRFLKIEYREVLDSAFDVTMKPAVTGFKNLDDLRTIIFTYGEFRTAAEVNLELPKAVVETITIAMDEEQERRYRKYVAQIEYILENPSPDGPSNIILGLLARLSLVALHASLEDGYSYATALEGGIVKKKVTNADGSVELLERRLSKPTYESPKLLECAKRVAASAHCGHIIFCEPTTVHLWMREVLVSHGVPRERIAILNAEETAPADRIRIAREFNGLASEPPAPGTCTRPTDSKTAPKYDVIIANSVAYEGVDLQVRTCTIHHLDLPWTPADLEQRNGRAVRQGNTLGTVQIYYYFADGSTDGYRFSLIDGKATWLADLIKTQARDTNNPAAQQQLTPEDILLMISRDKAKTKKLLEDKKARQIAEARAKIAKESARLLRQAAGRFADARRSTDPERAAKLREEGEQRLADLERMDPEAWPWAPWMYAVRDKDVLIPENGGAPVYEGLRIAKPRAGHTDQFEHLEFGRVTSDEQGDTIGLRAAGSPSWQVIAYKDGLLGGAPLLAEHFPREGSPAWPADDDVTTGEAIEKKIESSLRYGKFENLGWRGAADAWLERWWPRFADTIADKMAGAYAREKAPIVLDGKLVLATGEALREGALLPPTRAGWQQYLQFAPASGLAFAALREAGQHWWGRKIPQNLLSKDRDTREATEEGAEANGEAAGRGASRARMDMQVLSPEATRRLQEFVDSASPATGTDEEIDQRVLDNIFLQHAAMAMAGVSRQDRRQQAEAFQRDVTNFSVLRGTQFLWRAAGYGADVMGGPGRANLVISRDGVFLGVQQASNQGTPQYPLAVSHELAPEAQGPIVDTAKNHLGTILGIARRELAGGVTEDGIRALWRAARDAGHGPTTPPTSPPHTPSPAPSAPPPPAAPAPPPQATPGDRRGHVYQIASDWYGDTDFIRVLPDVRHVGFGDFEVDFPEGKLSITRHTDGTIVPKQEGRLHRLSSSGGGDALSDRIAKLIGAGTVEHVGTWSVFDDAMPPAQPTVPGAPNGTSESPELAHIYRIGGHLYADAAVLSLFPGETKPMGKIDYLVGLAGGSISVARQTTEEILPLQRGSLYLLTHDGGPLALNKILAAEVDNGRAKFVGVWPSFERIHEPPQGMDWPSAASPASPEALDAAKAERLREGRRQLYNRALARKLSAFEWPPGDDLDKAARMLADKIITLEEDFWRGVTPGEDQSAWNWRVEELEERLRDMFGKADEIASAELIASLTDATDFLDFVRDLALSRGADILPEFPRENGQPVPDPQAHVARGTFDAGVPASFDLLDTSYDLRAHETVFDGPALTVVYRADRPRKATASPTLRIQITRTGAQTYHARGELRNEKDRRTHAFSQSDVALGFMRELSSQRLAALLRPVRVKEPSSSSGARPAPALEQARIRPQDGVQEIVRLFNQSPDDPRLRLERTRGQGFVLVAYNDDAPEDAVVSIDLSPGFTIEDVRWLMYENRPARQSVILARLNRAIEAVKGAGRVASEPSELAPLLDQLRVRVAKLRGSERRGGQPGWRELWELVRDSAEPPSPTPREVMAWLEEQQLYDLAAELGAYLYSPERPQTEFFEEFREKLDKFYPRWRVAGSTKSESLSVATHAVRGEEPDHYLVKDSTLGPVRVDIELLPPERGKPNHARFRLRTGTLHPGDQVYDAEVDERIAGELRGRVDALETALKKTPTFLEDARRLLHLAGQLLNAPLCEGSTRDDALVAFNQAYAVYDDARRQVIEGRPARALEQLRQVAVHVATAAAKVAESCAEGQMSIAAPTIATPLSISPPGGIVQAPTSRPVSARRLRTLNARGLGRDTVARMLSEVRARGAFATVPEEQPMTVVRALERAVPPISGVPIQRIGDLAVLACTDPEQLDRARDVLMAAGYRPRTRDGRLIVRDRNPETSQ